MKINEIVVGRGKFPDVPQTGLNPEGDGADAGRFERKKIAFGEPENFVFTFTFPADMSKEHRLLAAGHVVRFREFLGKLFNTLAQQEDTPYMWVDLHGFTVDNMTDPLEIQVPFEVAPAQSEGSAPDAVTAVLSDEINRILEVTARDFKNENQ